MINFKIQVFIYSNEEDVAKSFLFYFNKICICFFCVITEKSLYLNLLEAIIVGYKLSFARSLNVSYLEMDG